MDIFTDYSAFEKELGRYLDEREKQFLQWVNERFVQEINDPCDQKVV